MRCPMPNQPNYQKAYRMGNVKERREQREIDEPLYRQDDFGDLFLTEKDWQEAKPKGAFNVVYFERLSRSQVLVDAAGKEVIEYPYLIDSALEGPMETYRPGERTTKEGQIIERRPLRRFLPDPLPELKPVVLLSAGTRWSYSRPPIEIYEQIENVDVAMIRRIADDLLHRMRNPDPRYQKEFEDPTFFKEQGRSWTAVAGLLRGVLIQVEYGNTGGNFPCLQVQAFGYEDLAQEILCHSLGLVGRLQEAFFSEEDRQLALEEKVQKGYAYGSSWREVFDLGRIGERKDVII